MGNRATHDLGKPENPLPSRVFCIIGPTSFTGLLNCDNDFRLALRHNGIFYLMQ